MNVMAYAHTLVKAMIQRWKRAAASCLAPASGQVWSKHFRYRDALRACLRAAHQRAKACGTVHA